MIVITGASDGLGHQLAKLYKENGQKVVNISRHACQYAAHNLLADLTKGSEIERAAKEVTKLKEPLEALINCAGVYSEQPLGKITEAEIKRAMATNVKAPILLVSELINRIKKDGSDIVNVSSTVGAKAYADQAVYGASKWALRGFSQNLQVELKDTKCRVISFCPGGFKSKLFEKVMGVDNTGDASQWMRPEDLAIFIKQILDLPPNMEVTEVFINRKVSG